MLDVFQAIEISLRDALPSRQQRVDAPQLPKPERRAHLVEAIVVAEPHMTQPGRIVIAPLIAQASQQARPFRIRRDDHSAFTRRHLFVGIESEHCRRPERARALTVMRRADRFACILDDGDLVTGSRVEQRPHRRGLTEDMHRNDRLDAPCCRPSRPGRRRRRAVRRVGEHRARQPVARFRTAAFERTHGLRDRRWVEVHRDGIDVHEDRHGSLVERGIGRGHERERRGDHQIARAHAGGDQRDVQAGRPARHGDRVRAAMMRGPFSFECGDHRPAAQGGRPEDLFDERHFFGTHLWSGHRNGHEGTRQTTA